jgi:BirA family transcriptional regulator, biotin operon repressor / biotin---[acetyl-CoA-carboxylase] ligase
MPRILTVLSARTPLPSAQLPARHNCAVTSPYTDLARPPLHAAALKRALVVPGGVWKDLVVVAETASTNADVAAAARAGAAEGLVITAESQIAGRGRQGRAWTMPPRSGIAVSVLLRPDGVVPARYGWLPLLAGVALVEAVRRAADVDATLKWPNDLLVGGRKCGGVLVEVHDGAVVAGIGVNTSLTVAELPVPTATSLTLAGAATADRDPLLRALLRRLADLYRQWLAVDGDPVASGLRETYLLHCSTVGREVRVDLPGGTTVTGPAEDVDADGRIVVAGAAYAAGDVVHVR